MTRNDGGYRVRPVLGSARRMNAPALRRLPLCALAWLAGAWSPAAAQSVALGTPTRQLDPAGGRLVVTASIVSEGMFDLVVEMPRGWEYVSTEGPDDPRRGRPFGGAQLSLRWLDRSPNPEQRIVFTVDYPAGTTSGSILPRLELIAERPQPRPPADPWMVVGRVEGAPIQFGPVVPPTIRHQPVSRRVGIEAVVWLSVAAEGTPPLRYQWRKDGRPIAGATGARHTIFPATLADAGAYDVTVANAAGALTSRVATLEIENLNPGPAAPVIEVQPQDAGTTAGGLAVFSVIAFSNHPLTYQWQRNGSDLAGATGQALVLPDAQPADAGSYAVVVRNAHGASTSRGAALTVGPPSRGGEPPQIEQHPADVSGVVSEPGRLRVAASGTPPLQYQWFHNGVPVPGATRDTLDLATALGMPMGGNFSVVASNPLGAKRSRVAAVQLMSVDTAPAALTGETVRAAEGGSVVFTAPASGSPPFSYRWFKDEAPIAGAGGPTLALPSVVAADAGRYRVVITSLLGSAQYLFLFTVDRTAVPPGLGPMPSSSSVPFEQPWSLTAPVSGSEPMRYQWTRDGRDIPGATDRRLSIAAAGFADAGEYAVRAENGGGSVLSPAVRLTVLPPATALAFEGPSGLPALATEPREANVPEGAGAGFHVTARAAALPLRYQWRRDGVAIPGATQAAYAMGRVTPADAGLYSVVVWNSRGATISETARLGVGPADPRAAAEAARRRLRNVSTRAITSGGDDVMTAGFVVSGTTSIPVLIRAVGPTLGAFGVEGRLAAARLEVFRGPALIAANADWSAGAEGGRIAAAAQRIGAFALPAGSRDAALLLSLDPGNYTARATGGEGVALVEVYDASVDETSPSPRIINLATRGRTGPGDQTLSAGFVVVGPGSKRVLMRAVGPGLGSFGVTGVVADPRLRLHAGTTPIVTNDNWEDNGAAAAVAVAGALTGAFPLAEGSRDAALVTELSPGAYTVQVSGAGDTSGVALVEVYEVP